MTLLLKTDQIVFRQIRRLSFNVYLSNQLLRNRRAAVFENSRNKDFPITYEQRQFPENIGYTKYWNSQNTSNLFEGKNKYECMIDDVLIRKIVHCTWHDLIVSELIIKRRFNTIDIAALVQRLGSPRRTYFLVGYTECLLSHLLKCPVKFHLQTVDSKKDVIFTLW